MHKHLEAFHDHMKKQAHLWKKIAILSLLLMQATSFFFNGKGFSWSYPLKEVAKNECRKQHWDTLSADCKEQLPTVSNADYNAHKNDPKYRLIYSVLWGGTYNDGWDMDKGGHEGVDFVSAEGTPIYAIEDGKVIKARAQLGYGNVITIKHTLDNGKSVYSTYAHLSAINVPEGINVKEGEMIGKMGHEGLAYGDHLHFVINTTPDNTYAFWDCPDLKKGEIAIGNQGLCRNYLQERTVDPIAWIESQGGGININGTLANTSNTTVKNVATTNTTTTSKTTRRRMPMIPMAPTTTTSAVQTPITSAIVQKTLPTATTTTTQKALSTRIVTPKEVTQNTVAFNSVESTKTASTRGAIVESNNQSSLGEEFLQRYTIEVLPSFSSRMSVGQTTSLILLVKDKTTGKPYVGMLPKDVTIIPSNMILTLSPQVVRVTNYEGKAIILISADKAGTTDLIISYNMKSLANIPVTIK